MDRDTESHSTKLRELVETRSWGVAEHGVPGPVPGRNFSSVNKEQLSSYQAVFFFVILLLVLGRLLI